METTSEINRRELMIRDKVHFDLARCRRRQKEGEFYYRMGWQSFMIVLCPVGVIFLCLKGAGDCLLGFLGMCLILGLMNPVILGGHTMKTIKRLLGITAVNGKLEALAKHLKIRFNLIPEHYECEKVEG